MADPIDSIDVAKRPTELHQILKLLGIHCGRLRDQIHEKHEQNIEITEAEDDALANHPLEDAVERIEQVTGIARDDLREASLRLSSSIGLKAWPKHPPLKHAKRVEVRVSEMDDSPAAPTELRYRDLLWILPRLRNLDHDGTTNELLREIWAAHRSTASEAGLPGPSETPPFTAGGAQDGKGQRQKRTVPKVAEMRAKAQHLYDLIQEQILNNGGKTLADLLRIAKVASKVFRTSEHFENARAEWETLQTLRDEGPPAHRSTASEAGLPGPSETPPFTAGGAQDGKGQRQKRTVPKVAEMRAKAQHLYDLIQEQILNNGGKTLADLLRIAKVASKVFRTSEHFENARAEWETLQTLRDDNKRRALDPNHEQGSTREKQVKCPSCGNEHLFVCYKCQHDDLLCEGCHQAKKHGVFT